MRRRDRCRSHSDPRGVVHHHTALALLSYLLRHGAVAAAGGGGPAGVAVLWLDHTRRLLDGFVVDAADRDLEEVAAPALRPRVRGSPVAAVAVGTVLPEGRRRPTKADRRRFVELRRRHDAAGVELVDWFVIGPPGRVWSMDQEVQMNPW